MAWKCDKYVSDTCRHDSICNNTGVCMGYSKYIEPKEKPMAEKFIFDSEEQVNRFTFDVCTGHISEDARRAIIKEIKNQGLIRKTELQTLVGEAEEMWKKMNDNCEIITMEYMIKLSSKQRQTIQALKKEVIKLGGKI